MSKKPEKKEIVVQSPAFKSITLKITGTAPYVQHAFSQKERARMRETQAEGKKSKSKKDREAKDFELCYEQAKHLDADGRCGIPANAIKSAMIDACRMTGAVMTSTKLLIFVEADSLDASDGTPLVTITKGEPRPVEHTVRLASGVADIRVRPMWDPGWEALVTIRYDSDMIDSESVANLLERAGQHVGVGEGRPGSKKSCGMGWGMFTTRSTNA